VARRSDTAVDYLADPKKFDLAHQTEIEEKRRRRKLSDEEVTDLRTTLESQRAATEKRAERLVKKVGVERAQVEKVKDPHARANAANESAEFHALAYSAMTDVRDDTIKETLETAASAFERNRHTTKFAHDLNITPSRLRQIKVKDRIGQDRMLRTEVLQGVLTYKYLEAEYFAKGKTMSQIATAAGTDAQTVSRYLEHHFRGSKYDDRDGVYDEERGTVIDRESGRKIPFRFAADYRTGEDTKPATKAPRKASKKS
jgi:hypothetical protein